MKISKSKSDSNSSISAMFRGDRKRKSLVPKGGRQLISALLLILATSGQLASSLRFTSVQMPALVQRGTNFWLSCQYELSRSAASESGGGVTGREQLYSVKWYRNNEEFYRLIFGGGGGGTSGQQQQHLESKSNKPSSSSPLQQQQQYFSQTGVNVLMSASNATHVRLLNASLESDGSYACEISTQNLSTIRHEKEIKVYVLPHLKLNLIGLRSIYSPGERVELNCLSDFSRPAGALGWFINGQQIMPNSQQEHFGGQQQQHFELASSARHKSGELKLSRASLTLKFKLTNELLRGVLANKEEQGEEESAQPSRLRGLAGNQSKLLLMKSFVNGGRETAASISGARLFELLKLECRYKLAEVSDVTFNELRVAASSTFPLNAAHRRTGSDFNRGIASPSSPSSSTESDLDEEENLRRRRRRHALASAEFKLSKSHGTQVSQSRSPARRSDLLATVGVTSPARAHQRTTATAAACHLGMLAREDPVLLESDRDGGDQDVEQTVARDGPLELPLGFTLSVNCSTLGALALAQPEPANNQRPLRHGGHSGGGARYSQRWPIITTSGGGGTGADNDDDDRDQPSSVYCSDPSARKRLLVSGRTWPTTVQLDESQQQQQQQQQQRRHHVAYVNLASTSRKQEAPHVDDKLSLLGVSAGTPEGNQAGGGKQPRKSLVGGGQLHHAAAAMAGQAATTDDLDEKELHEEGPPPLLEWFINNQEAPRSNARYTPELPLLAAVPMSLSGRPRGGATSGEDPSQSLPSIDYLEYFANFNRRRPVDQHLNLQLTLEKRHFMTPDSLLKLRCSSTQAQVLASDSLTVSLVVLPQGGATNLLGQQNLEQQQTSGSHWNQRTAGGATAQSQIKSKYLHQSPRSSIQARQRASGEQRHLIRGQANQMPPGLASASEGGSSSSNSGGTSSQWPALAITLGSCLMISQLLSILIQLNAAVALL